MVLVSLGYYKDQNTKDIFNVQLGVHFYNKQKWATMKRYFCKEKDFHFCFWTSTSMTMNNWKDIFTKKSSFHFCFWTSTFMTMNNWKDIFTKKRVFTFAFERQRIWRWKIEKIFLQRKSSSHFCFWTSTFMTMKNWKDILRLDFKVGTRKLTETSLRKLKNLKREHYVLGAKSV